MATISDTTFTFCGITIHRRQLPPMLPFPTYQSAMKEHFMTDGEDGNGIRVLEPLGAHISHCDFTFEAGQFTSDEVQTFEAAFFDQRTPRTLTISVPGDSSISYLVLFAANGFSPRLHDRRVEYYQNLYHIEFKLHILERTSSEGSGS